VIAKLKDVLEAGKDVYYTDWTNNEIEYIRGYNLFTAKPVVFLVNVGVTDWEKGTNKYIGGIQEWVDKHNPGSPVIPFSATFEGQLSKMSDTEREKYLKEHKTKSMIEKVITSGYKALHLIHFFTAGEDEVKCWTIRAGTKAPQAAGTIHSDFERGFICAETMAYKDFKELGGEAAVKTAGKCLQNGKGYEVQDGDIMYFKFNKPTTKK